MLKRHPLPYATPRATLPHSPGSALMCGIVGLFFKRGAPRATLGPLLVGMLSQMTERGPDSTGVALYGDAAPEGAFKATLHAPNVEYDWAAFEAELSAAFSLPSPARRYKQPRRFYDRLRSAAVRRLAGSSSPRARHIRHW